MTRSLSEQRVLQKLGITDFRHMTKDKVVKFASMLPYMDPEVAKKALDQFPAFKDMAINVVSEYKSVVEKMMDSNLKSQDLFYQVCNRILDSLQKELEESDISSGDRERIERNMIEVAQMIGEKDTENKSFLLRTVAIVSFFFVGVVGTAAALLGSNTQTGGGDSNLIEA